MPVYRYKGSAVDSVFIGGQILYLSPGSNVDIPPAIVSTPYVGRLLAKGALVPVLGGGGGPIAGGSGPDLPETPTPAPAPAPAPTPETAPAPN